MDLGALKEREIIEAALYLFDRPCTLSELSTLIQRDEETVERYIEELRDMHMDQKRSYAIFEIDEGKFQLRLRDEVAARLHWPFIQRSEVPRHLLKVLSLIAFKEYVLEEQVTPSKIQKVFGKKALEDIEELSVMNLVTITPKGNRRILNVTEDFLGLFKLPNDPTQIKTAIQSGLREYALSQLQFE